MRKLANVFMTALLAISLTGCLGAGVNAPTRMINQVTDGVEATLDSNGNLIYIRNVYISLNEMGDATLIGTIVNQKNTDDSLLAMRINNVTQKIEAQPALFNKPIIFGGPSATTNLTIPNSGFIAGNYVPVSLFFGLAGSVTLNALVVAA